MNTKALEVGSAAPVESNIDDGFTAEERAQFADMQNGAPAQDGHAAADNQAALNSTVAGQQLDPHAAELDNDDDNEVVENDASGSADISQQKSPPRRVGYPKYKAMEERAKKAEQERDQIKETYSRTDERLKLLNEALTSGQKQQEARNEEQDPEPDPEQDIFGWVQWSRRKTARLEQMVAEQQQSTARQSDEQRVASSYMEDARAFATKEPAFSQAYNFLMVGRTAELALYLFGKEVFDANGNFIDGSLTREEVGRIKAEISAEERELVQNALRNQRSPAQAVFNMAKARGFRPQAQTGGQQKPTASVSPPDNQRPQPSVKEEIARLQEGTRNAASLSLGGGAPANPLTPERLANMPQEEFEAIMDSLTPSQQRAAMGG
jgi:hypothetical protein